MLWPPPSSPPRFLCRVFYGSVDMSNVSISPRCRIPAYAARAPFHSVPQQFEVRVYAAFSPCFSNVKIHPYLIFLITHDRSFRLRTVPSAVSTAVPWRMPLSPLKLQPRASLVVRSPPFCARTLSDTPVPAFDSEVSDSRHSVR